MKINRNTLIISLSLLIIALLVLNIIIIHESCVKRNDNEIKIINKKDTITTEVYMTQSLKRK